MRVCLLAMFAALSLGAAVRAWAQLDFGPYVQNTDHTKATVIWYTKTSESGTLRFGKQPGQWEGTIDGGTGTVHRVAMSDLQPNTKYFYEVASGAKVYASGEQYYVRTHPRPGARVPFRFMAFGDFGDGSDGQKANAAQMLKDEARHSFALLLGDIVYSSGDRENYLKDYFPVYGDLIRHRAWWPTLGNHDIKSQNGAAYFEFFETPANNPGKVENYYSFDYANAHFVSLDDELLFEGADLEKQMAWVKQDLQAAKARGQRWLIVMWHKPPYSAGTHSDDEDIQKNFIPTLEAEGVDLVLNGHSHVAERTFLLAEHKIINNDLSNYPKKGFEKGAVYVVAGAGGKDGEIEGKHALMAFQLGNMTGYESIYVSGDTLRGSWVRSDGRSMDQFVMIKTGSNSTDVRMLAHEAVPENFAVHYPNPFRPSRGGEPFRLAFELSDPASVRAEVYDILGRVVARLSAGEIFPAGNHVLSWEGRDREGALASNGIYFYKIQTGSRAHTAKLVIAH